MVIKSLVIEVNGKRHEVVRNKNLLCKDCSLMLLCLMGERIKDMPCSWVSGDVVFRLVKEGTKQKC